LVQILDPSGSPAEEGPGHLLDEPDEGKVTVGREERDFHCSNCCRQRRGRYLPDGWYSLTQRKPRGQFKRRGLYCSFDCLVARVLELRDRGVT
jgi:hypothetical protein